MISCKYIPCLFDSEIWIEFDSRNLGVPTVLQELFRKHPEARGDDMMGISVRVNGKKISPFLWQNAKLEDGDRITIIQELGGTTLGVILTAIGTTLGSLTGGVIGVSGIYIGVGAGFFVTWQTIGIVLTIATVIYSVVSSLTAPGVESPGPGLRNSPTYGWSGISTQVQPGIPVPIVYGLHLVGGNLIGGYDVELPWSDLERDGDVGHGQDSSRLQRGAAGNQIRRAQIFEARSELGRLPSGESVSQ